MVGEDGRGLEAQVYCSTTGSKQIIGTLWRGDRVHIVSGLDAVGSGGWCRIEEDGRWSSSPTAEAWCVTCCARNPWPAV